MKKDRLKEAFKKFIEQAYKYCILGLFVCWFMKLFGIDWFGLDLNNKLFQDLDNLFANHLWLKQVYYCFTLMFQTYLLYCIVYNKEETKKSVLYILLITPICILTRVLTSKGNILYNYSMIVEILFTLCVITKLNFRKIPKSILVILLNILYQMISLNTRSLNLKTHSYGFIGSQILSIDLYLLLYLSKEVARMDDGTWFFFGLTAWIYGVAGAIVGIFKLHPIRTAKEWYARGKEKENARKTEKELKKNRGK